MNYVGQTNSIGEYHGYGEYTWEDGSNYCGYWGDGEFHGKGSYSWPDGDSYVGDWVHGKRTGKGSFFWVNSDVYQGDFINGKRDGEGIQWYADGNKYQGQWCDGERHGHGLFYIAASQAVYDVSWVKGQANGYGKFITQQRDIYEGNFLNGKRHGDGTFTWADGSRIMGYWENGIRDDSKVQDLQPKLPDWSPPQSFLDAKPAPSSHFAPVPPPGWNLTGATCSRESSPIGITSTPSSNKLNLGSSGASSDGDGIKKNNSSDGDGIKKNNSMPEWQKKMLEKKREQQQKTPPVVQPKDLSASLDSIPAWKKKLLEKKQGLTPVISQDKELVAPNIVIPEWQLKVLQRKREQEEQKKIEEQRKRDQEEQQKKDEEKRKRDQEEQLRQEELKKEQELQRQLEQEEQIRILKQQLEQQQQQLQQQQLLQQQLLQQQAQEKLQQQQQQLHKQRLLENDDVELQIQQEQLQQILMELEQQELPQTLPQFVKVQQQPRQSNAHLDQAEWGTPEESSPQQTLAALLDVDTDLSQIDQPDEIEIPNKVKSTKSTRGHSPRKEKPLDNSKEDTSILNSISLITPRGKQAAKVFKKKINKLTKEKKDKDPCSNTPPGEESRLKKSRSINKVVKSFRTGSPFKNKKSHSTLESIPYLDKTPPNDPLDTNEHPLGRLEGKPKEEGILFTESFSEMKSPRSMKFPSFSLGRTPLSSKENLEIMEEEKKEEMEPLSPVLVEDLRVEPQPLEPQPLQDLNSILDDLDSINSQIGDIQLWASDSDEIGDIISELDIDHNPQSSSPIIIPKFKPSSGFMKKTVSRTGLGRPSSPLLGANRQATNNERGMEKGRFSQPVISQVTNSERGMEKGRFSHGIRQMIVTPPDLNVDELLASLDSNGDGEVQTKTPRETRQPISVTPRLPGKTGHLTQFFGDLQVDFNDLFLGDV